MIIREYLESFDFNKINEVGGTLLHSASREGHKDLVNEIIEFLKNKKQLNEYINQEDQKKWTPVYYAIDVGESGFPDILGK